MVSGPLPLSLRGRWLRFVATTPIPEGDDPTPAKIKPGQSLKPKEAVVSWGSMSALLENPPPTSTPNQAQVRRTKV